MQSLWTSYIIYLLTGFEDFSKVYMYFTKPKKKPTLYRVIRWETKFGQLPVETFFLNEWDYMLKMRKWME